MTATSSVDPSAERRFIDTGAVFAGWVGLGMALVVAIAFELIIAVQTLVFLAAAITGAIIGAYANVRSERWRPRLRVLANAAYAGVVSGVGLALLYVLLRLVFVFGDNGYPDFNRTNELGEPVGPTCATGPGCTYARYLDAGRGPELEAAGVTDDASFGAFMLREQLTGGLVLVGLTLAGAAVGGGLRAIRRPPDLEAEEASGDIPAHEGMAAR